MKFTVNKSDMVNVLSKVQGLTSRKTDLNITECVLIETNEFQIRITATDLESGFEGFCPATVEVSGAIAINSKKLHQIVKEFPYETLTIYELENRFIEIKEQGLEYRIVCMNHLDFPEITKIDDLDLLEIDSNAFGRMIQRTLIVSGESEDLRAHIKGAYFEKISNGDQKCIRLVSTDGSRLTVTERQIENDLVECMSGVLIPKKGLHEVMKALDDGSVWIGIKENHFVVKKQMETVVIRLLDGSFPNYMDIIDLDDRSFEIKRDAFLRLLKRMSIMTSANYNGVYFNISEGQLEVQTSNPDIGESKEAMKIPYQGDLFHLAFNPKFFIDSLNMIDADIVSMNIVDGQKPCIIKEKDGNDYISAIMPMRL